MVYYFGTTHVCRAKVGAMDNSIQYMRHGSQAILLYYLSCLYRGKISYTRMGQRLIELAAVLRGGMGASSRTGLTRATKVSVLDGFTSTYIR